MRKESKRFLAYFTSLCVIGSTMISGIPIVKASSDLSAAGNTVQLTDIKGHWSEDKVIDGVNKNLVSGYEDGTFKPDNKITRAEFIAIINRTFGYSEKGKVSFSDVSAGDWFADEVSKAGAAGYISGYEDGTFRPDEGITREEAAAILSRILRLNKATAADGIKKFSDASSISSWSKDFVAAIVEGGYISGYPDGTIKPANTITRAESIAVINRAVGTLYNIAGTYGPETGKGIEAGNVTITTDVTLRNTTVNGNLYMTEGVGSGSVTLENVTVKGKTFIFGGGSDSIVIKDSDMDEVSVDKKDDKVRIEATGTTLIEKTVINSGAKLEEKELSGAGFNNVSVVSSKAPVQFAGKFEKIEIENQNADIGILTGTVKKLDVKAGAKISSINIAEGASVTTLTLNDESKVSGKGSIDTANVNVNGCEIAQTPKNLVAADKVSVKIAGVIKPESVTTGGSSSSSSGGSSNKKHNGISSKDQLISAVASGKSSIRLDRSIDLGNDALDINSAITINGNGNVITGDVSVNAAGTVLQNVTITGDLLLAESIGDGDATLKGVTVNGTTSVKGGGANSIHFEDSVLVTVIVNKNNGAVRIVATGNTTVTEVQLETPATVQENGITGTFRGFDNIVLTESLQSVGDTQVELMGHFETINSRAVNVRINLSEETDIRTLILNAAANILGAGTIETAQINADGSTLAQRPQNVVLDNSHYGSIIAFIQGQVVDESYSSATSAQISGISATQNSISVELDTFLAGLTANDFNITATLDGQNYNLSDLHYDSARNRFIYEPVPLTDNIGKTLHISVAPASGSAKLLGEGKNADVLIGTGFGGRITDISNVGISGAVIKFRAGLDTTQGDVVGQATTDRYGYYSIALPVGEYTGEISGTGLVTTYLIAVAPSDIYNINQNETGIRAAGSNEIKIMLSWGEKPRDEDSHLEGPSGDGVGRFHTWYADKQDTVSGIVYADLDWDDVNSYGPETTTIRRLVDGNYRFYVHNFSQEASLRNSAAVVKVFKGNAAEPYKTFNVPTGEGSELYWIVFDMTVSDNGTNIQITEVNMMTNDNPAIAQKLSDLVSYLKEELATAVEGTNPGQYAPGSKAALQNVLDSALVVLNDSTSTYGEMFKAYNDLKTAHLEFKEKLVPGHTGTISFDKIEYNLVDNNIATIKVIDADLNTNADSIDSVNVKWGSYAWVNPIEVTLQETGVNTGEFSKTINLMTDTNSLPLKAGDYIGAVYIDAINANGIIGNYTYCSASIVGATPVEQSVVKSVYSATYNAEIGLVNFSGAVLLNTENLNGKQVYQLAAGASDDYVVVRFNDIVTDIPSGSPLIIYSYNASELPQTVTQSVYAAVYYSINTKGMAIKINEHALNVGYYRIEISGLRFASQPDVDKTVIFYVHRKNE